MNKPRLDIDNILTLGMNPVQAKKMRHSVDFYKRCNCCGGLKPVWDYYLQPSGKPGYRAVRRKTCRDCEGFDNARNGLWKTLYREAKEASPKVRQGLNIKVLWCDDYNYEDYYHDGLGEWGDISRPADKALDAMGDIVTRDVIELKAKLIKYKKRLDYDNRYKRGFRNIV